MDTDLPPTPNTPGPGGPPPPPETPAQPVPPQPPPILGVPRLQGTPPKRNTGWKVAVFILASLLGISLFNNFWHLAQAVMKGPLTETDHAGVRLQETVVEHHRSDNKIVVISIEGIISSDLYGGNGYGLVEYVRDQFKLAGRDPDVKAVLLKVDSPGGEVLASDDISRLVSQFQKNTGKPVIAVMNSMAASGGYYVSAPCRWIVANELTITGSIGVIFHSFNYRGLLDKVGVRPEVYKSGRFKDMLSGDKQESDITPEERQMMQKLIDETYAKFKSVVAEGREWANTKNKDNKDGKGRELSQRWADYADGRVLSGKEAYEHGFIDELGNMETAVSRARKLAGIEDANLVQYQQLFDLSNLFRLFVKSEPTRLKVDLGMDGPKLKAGHLYFLAPLLVR